MIRSVSLTACAAVLVAAQAARAELSARDVWDQWRDLSREVGQTLVAGSEETAEGRLILNDVAVTIDMPDGRATGTLPRLALAEQADGTVRATLSDSYALRFDMTGQDGTPFGMVLRSDAPGLVIIASGAPGAVDYTYSAPEIALRMEQVTVDGQPMPTTAGLRLTRPTGSYRTGASGAAIASTMAADALSAEIDAQSPEAEGRVSVTATYSDIATETAGPLTGLAALADPAALLARGVPMRSSLVHGGGALRLAYTGPEGDLSLSSTSESGAAELTLADGAMAYSGGATGMSVAAAATQSPLPQVTLDLTQAQVSARLPVAEGADPAPFSLSAELTGLTLDDAVWQALDPAGQLPRDPADLALALSGTASLPAATRTGAGAAPELQTLAVDRLRLSVLGAELTGTGNFVFDGAGAALLPGLPAAQGQAQLRLRGAAALLERLVQIGAIGPDQAIGANLILGMFARPAGEDVLDSDVVLAPDGSITANGQRLR